MSPEAQVAMIQAGTQLGTTGINAIAQSNLNKKQREWNVQQYNIQRQHALQDWQMQQEYNSPTAQMKRLEAAGLNPHLIYGSGGGTTAAQPVRGTELKSWTPQAPQIQIPDVMGKIYDMRIRNAQNDLMKEEIQNKRENRALMAATRLKVMAETDIKNFDLEMKNRFGMQLAETQAITAELNRQIKEEDLQRKVLEVSKSELELDIAKQLKNNTIVGATLDTLRKKVAITKDETEINRINEAIKQIQADTQLKRLDYDLYIQKGFTRNAPWYAKAVADAIDAGDWTDLQATLRLMIEGKYPGQSVIGNFIKGRTGIRKKL